MKFTSDTYGTINGVRFYKSAANTGHACRQLVGRQRKPAGLSDLQQRDGLRLAASQLLPAGPDLAEHHLRGRLLCAKRPLLGRHQLLLLSASRQRAMRSTARPCTPFRRRRRASNGFYSYSSTSTFPTSTFQGTNYWVDPVFTPASPPGQVTNVAATAGQQSATVSWSAPSTGGPPTSYIVTPYIGSTAQTPTTVTGSPPATTATISGLTPGTSYTFTVQATNPNGSGPSSSQSNAVTPTAPSAPPAPSNVTASPATGQALVSWTAPSSNGGSPIRSASALAAVLRRVEAHGDTERGGGERPALTDAASPLT